MKHNKIVTRLLLSILLAIWGTVGYQIVEAFSSQDDAVTVTNLQLFKQENNREGRFVYLSDVRDPFMGDVRPDPSKHSLAKKQREGWVPPPIRLTGILTAKRKRTAAFQTTDKQTFFLAEGDTLRGIKVVKIDPLKVTYVYMKKQDVWFLDRP